MKAKSKLDLEQAAMRFRRVFAEQMKTTRKDAGAQFKTEVKGIVRFLFAVTPPMGGKEASIKYGQNIRVDFAQGRKAGKRAIESDINRAMSVSGDGTPEFRKKKKYGPEEALSYYLKRRTSKKRVRGNFMLRVSGKALMYVKRAILARQGWVASGWNSAASAMGTASSAWIKRFHSALSQSFSAMWTGDKQWFQAINGTNHSNSKQIERNISSAIDKQSDVMERRMENIAKKQLKSSLG
jgi:hypothetical protein